MMITALSVDRNKCGKRARQSRGASYVHEAPRFIARQRRDLSRYFAPAGTAAPMCSIIAPANSLHFSSFAPSMRRSKS
jgi:hypothetical protein